MKRTIAKFLAGLIVLILAQSPVSVSSAHELSSTTEGTISFTGSFEAIGEPSPPPVSGAQPSRPQPVGSLPQTNSLIFHTGYWLGSLLIVLASWIFFQKNKQIRK